MAIPVILTVDDDPQVSSAIGRDLRKQFRPEYRILKTASGAEALQVVQELKQRNHSLALFLVDQRMPGMDGTEFLAQAIKSYPEAKKVLLTAYADTTAAIQAINEIGLDYYLMKPWDPPEENLFPVLTELLEDWRHSVDIPYDGIRVAGTLWSASSHKVKDFLARSQIPYRWLDIEKDRDAEAWVDTVENAQNRLPVIFFPDGSTLIDPDLITLADKVGLKTIAEHPFYDLIVIGAGPAGLAASVYGSSEGLKTLLIDKQTTGGQAGTSSLIENYLGFPKGVSGADLARRATTQTIRLGTEIITAREVKKIHLDDVFRVVTLADGTELNCLAVVVATGVSTRRLEIPGIDEVTGAGVYYGAALTEASHYKDEHVFVVGGANSAGQGAMFFSRYARQVTMLVRRSLSISMSQYLIDQIDNTPNIDVELQSEVVEIHGKKKLEGISYRNRETGEITQVNTPALFLFIGADPHSTLVDGIVEMSEDGFIRTGTDLNVDGALVKSWPLKRDPYLLETSVPGLFAVGDVRLGALRRVASAVGQGSASVSFVHEYLKTV